MKYLKRFLLFIITLLILLLLYLEFGGIYILNTDNKREIVWYMRSSKKLPGNFVNFYNTVYPNSTLQNSWNFYIKSITHSNLPANECPCRQTGNRIMPILDIQNKSTLDYFLLIRYIEQNYSQEDCLNFNFSNFDFLNNNKGIEQVSRSVFNKQAEELQPLEMGEILALYNNPRKSNRYRNPEYTKERATYFYNLYLNNLKK
ncbi:Transglycosylase [Chryseobacterium rhizoplanae]|uniref:Transglycosylase n=1 Tax=Chryseobacterium rhizoplanae TaxID=1609531 RepID=A0A521F3L8_9FLAO|nr:transglycosylase domain-containing protein [Chryseobacterium rhizoplanae]SMO90764.1 Transglycosylase [Chryseobacterium rhizoplanae]